MSDFQLQIRVRFKSGILDPQAEAIETALKKLHFDTVKKVECDKVYRVDIGATDSAHAEKMGQEMANQLLSNLVMENFEIEIIPLIESQVESQVKSL